MGETSRTIVVCSYIQVPVHEQAVIRTVTPRLSDFDLLLIQISKYDKAKLKKATTVSSLIEHVYDDDILDA